LDGVVRDRSLDPSSFRSQSVENPGAIAIVGQPQGTWLSFGEPADLIVLMGAQFVGDPDQVRWRLVRLDVASGPATDPDTTHGRWNGDTAEWCQHVSFIRFVTESDRIAEAIPAMVLDCATR
jgi:hypothetical protein